MSSEQNPAQDKDPLDELGRDGLRQFIVAQRNALLDSIAGLDEETIETAVVAGEWTIRDVLAHIWAWDEEALRTMEHWTGPRAWQQGVDYGEAWNQRMHAAYKDRTLLDILDGLTTCHRKRMAHFDTLSEEDLRTEAPYPWGGHGSLAKFLFIMAQHDADHYMDIVTFREQQGL